MRLTLLSLVLLALVAGAQDIRIAPHRGDCAGSVSFTFDDGSATNIDFAAPALEAFGYRGTFFLITDSVPAERTDAQPDVARKGAGGWNAWKALAERGHEIGNHSRHHGDLTTIKDAAKLADEIDGAADTIAARIGVAPVSFAWPFCKRNAQVIEATNMRHLVARGHTPQYADKDFKAEAGNAMLADSLAKSGWHIALIHGTGPEFAAEFRQHLQAIKDRGDLWVDTYGTIGRYRAEAAAATLTVARRDATGAAFTLAQGAALTDPRYDVPLTIVIPVEEGSVGAATAARAGQPLPVTVKPNEVLVDVAPGVGEVVVTFAK